MLRIHTDIIQLLRRVCKVCQLCQRSQEWALVFLAAIPSWWILLPICKSVRWQKTGCWMEGSPAVYMNLPFLVAFFNDWLFISSDNLLQKSLYMSLQSVEFIAMLRV
jgi:hypothetical protein